MPRSSITRREVTEESERSTQGGERQKRRFQEILKSLQQNGTISVEELSSALDVTVVTIRRDLNTLEQQGLLSRTHGGAVAGHPMFYESFKNDRSFMAQVEHFADEKRRIGRAAAELVQPGETIAVTPGTTTAEIIRCLPFNADLTVVTNTVNIAMELSKRKDVDVFVTGGHLRGDWFSLVGPSAIQSFENMLIHTLFIGADGFDAEWGASCHNAEEAELNNVLVSRSRRHIAVADHSKLNVVAKWRICETSSIHTLITDSGGTDELIAPFLAAGIEVVRV
jgi:DeoR family transcriptional regulator of aga operon